MWVEVSLGVLSTVSYSLSVVAFFTDDVNYGAGFFVLGTLFAFWFIIVAIILAMNG